MPRRFLIAFLLFLCSAYINVVKHNLKNVITLMVHRDNKNITRRKLCEKSEDVNGIQGLNDTDTVQTFENITDYGWTKDTVTNANTVKWVSYGLSHPLGGYISDKYGSNHVISASLASLSILTLFMPLVVDWSNGNDIVLYVLHLCSGFSAGCLYPAIYSALAHWIPYREWGRLCCFAFTGLPAGTTVVQLVTISLIAKTSHWSSPFYLYGSAGIGICLLWLVIGSSSPENYSDLSSNEDLYLKRELGDRLDHGKKEVPMKDILRSRAVWALVVGFIGHIWYRSVVGFFLHGFLEDIVGEEVDRSIIWGPLAGLIRIITAIAVGTFTDYAVNRNLVDVIFLRHFFTNIAVMGPPIYILTVTFAVCRIKLAETLLFISMILSGTIFAGLRLVPMDLSPNYCGTVTAITHGVSTALASLVSVTQKSGSGVEKTLLEYRIMFMVTIAISAISNLIFLIFGEISLRKWNTPPSLRKYE